MNNLLQGELLPEEKAEAMAWRRKKLKEFLDGSMPEENRKFLMRMISMFGDGF